MVPWHVIFGCRACPYARPAVWSIAEWTTLQWWSGEGNEQDDEGKGKRRGSTGHEYHHRDDEGKGIRTWRDHMRETIYWGTPMGKGNEQDERNAEWLWRRNLLGNREDNDEVVFEWPQPPPPGVPPGHQGKGKGTSSSSSSWTSAGRHGKGNGKQNVQKATQQQPGTGQHLFVQTLVLPLQCYCRLQWTCQGQWKRLWS